MAETEIASSHINFVPQHPRRMACWRLVLELDGEIVERSIRISSAASRHR